MFRRVRRLGLRRSAARAGVAEEYIQASQYLANGQPADAAQAFARAAGLAQAAGRLRQAANLHANAAYAWVDAGAQDRALDQSQQAMVLFSSRGLGLRAAQFRGEFEAYLRNHHLGQTADTFVQTIPQQPAVDFGQPPSTVRRGDLPATCPQCGAPIRPDQVEWIDEGSAVCEFCAAVIKAR